MYTSFTLIFDKYVAQIGPGVATTESRKFCQVNLQLHYPQGFQYSILKTIYRGFAQLDAGVTGSQEATYYFSGRMSAPFPPPTHSLPSQLLSHFIPSNTPAKNIVETNQASTKSTFKGPLQQDYKIEDDVALASVIWSPCGADLPINIKSQISLASTVSTAKGLLTDDSVDGTITWVTGIQWRRC